MICLSNCWFPSHYLPTHVRPLRASLPAPHSSRTSGAFHGFPAVRREVSSEPPQSDNGHTTASEALPGIARRRQAAFPAEASGTAGKTLAKLS